LDLGRKVDAALSLREISIENGYSLHIPPTVFEELARLTENADLETRKIAAVALSKLAEFRILPLDLPPESDAIADEFSRLLRRTGAIPDSEVNDGIILAEASLGEAALLVSSDSHLIMIEPDDLRMYFMARDLTPIPVTTPHKILRFFEKLQRMPGRY
jgi:hypothetical protein